MELQLVSGHFSTRMDDSFAPYNGFFRSFYSTPKEMDFGEFLRYYPPYECISPFSEEYFEVERLEKKETGNGFPKQGLPYPIWKYRRADVDKTLIKYADITCYELDKSKAPYYSDKYDSYYNFTSDCGPGTLEPYRGTVEANIYTFYEKDKEDYFGDPEDIIVTKMRKVGDNYKFISREVQQSAKTKN